MKLPIPNDWNGEDWACIQVQWPNSPLWIAILNGWLSQSARGRTWDENSGTITEAQTIGREIWQRNRLMNACSDQEIAKPTPEQQIIYIGYSEDDEEGENDMGCSPCLRWNFGVLEYLSCGEWVPVPGSQADEPAFDDDTDPGDTDVPLPGDDEGLNEDIKCRVAWLLANAMWEVHSVIMDKVDDVLAIPIIGQLVCKELPQYTLSSSQIGLACAMVITQTVGFDLDTIFGSETSQEPDLAAWMMRFLPESYVISSADYDKVANGLNFYSFHEGIEINAGQFVEGLYWMRIFRALGRGTINEIAAQARMLPEGSYDCEDHVILVPDYEDVYFSGSIVDLWKPSGVNAPTLTTSKDKNIATIHISGTGTNAYTDQQFKLGLACAVSISSITLKFSGRGPTNDWVTPVAPFLTDLQAGTLEGTPTITKTVVGGSVGEGFISVKFDWSGLAVPTFFGWPSSGVSFRMNPRDIAAPYAYDFVVEILGYETA